MGTRALLTLSAVVLGTVLSPEPATAGPAAAAMSFVPNRGQAGDGVAWLAHSPRAAVAFSGAGLTVAFPRHGRSVGLTFVDADGPAAFHGLDRLPGTANYFLGADRGSWSSGVPTFRGLELRQLYPGVDLRFEGEGSGLKGTFVVTPGADRSRIRWRYSGVDRVVARPDGALELVAGELTVEEVAPVAWQEIEGRRIPVEVSYRLAADGTVGLGIGAHDPRRELVIDPYLEFATLLGGGEGEEGREVVVDGDGNAYVTGSTLSADFPGAGPPQSAFAGPFSPSNLGDAFVFKLAPDGETVLFMTYLGGAGEEVGDAIALDGEGNVVIAGSTESTDFPTVNALQGSQGGQDCSSAPCNDLFVAKLSAAGDALVFSTYLGGSRNESAGLVDFGTRLHTMGVDTDSAGNVYVLGASDSPDFPTVNGYQASRAGLDDLVLAKLSPDGGQLLYSTYLGGSGAEYSGDIAADDSGRVWLAGGTLSSDWPVRNAFDPSKNPVSDAVVAELDTTVVGNASLIWSTHLGGDDSEQAFAIGVDEQRNVFVAGFTESSDFPVAGAFQPTNASVAAGEPNPRDAFLAVLAPDGRTLVYGTYLGGSARDVAYDLAVEAGGTAVIAGPTSSDDLPLRLAWQSRRFAGIDLFVSRIDPQLPGPASLTSSSYLGGGDSDVLYGVDAGPDGSIFVTGAIRGVDSSSFPVGTTLGANGTGDGVLVARLEPGLQAWMLVGSRADGLNDSIWRTAVAVLNPEQSDAEVELRFHGAGGVLSRSWTVPAGAQLLLQDAVGELGGSGNGAIEVLADREVKVTSRTYNLVAPSSACSPGGTLGQGFASFGVREALHAGESAWLPQLVETDAYRTNIALTNTGRAPARVTVRLHMGSGSQVATTTVDLAPGQWTQLNRPFFQLAGDAQVLRGYARVTVEEGSGVLAVGSVVDNVTNDPTTIPMVPAEGAGASESWVVVGSHADGANMSRWRTDLGVLHPGGGTAQLSVRVHAPTTVYSFSTAVSSGNQLLFEDVVGFAGFSGSAAIEVVADRPLVVTSRTYNQVAAGRACYAEGTLGQELVGHPAGAGLDAGQSAWLTQLTENAAFRTNVALTNTGDETAVVTVRLYSGDGAEVASFQVTLAPGEWFQDNRPFFNRAGRTDLDSGYARVTVEAGGAVLAIGSVVDNLTNDPTTVEPVL